MANKKHNGHEIAIQKAPTLSLAFEITGTADLIQNRFSQKAVEEMLKKHMGIATKREKKNPRQVIEDATVRNTDGRVSLAPTGLKKAILTASTQVKGFKKTQLRTAIFVAGNSIPITYSEMIPRMDMVRTSGIGRVPDVRFRPQFKDWKAKVIINFAETLSAETIVDLLFRAGNVGLGEWRPEKDGTFGTFTISRHITDAKEIAQVETECAVPLESLRIPEWAMDVEIDSSLLQKIMASQSEEATQ